MDEYIDECKMFYMKDYIKYTITYSILGMEKEFNEKLNHVKDNYTV